MQGRRGTGEPGSLAPARLEPLAAVIVDDERALDSDEPYLGPITVAGPGAFGAKRCCVVEEPHESAGDWQHRGGWR